MSFLFVNSFSSSSTVNNLMSTSGGSPELYVQVGDTCNRSAELGSFFDWHQCPWVLGLSWVNMGRQRNSEETLLNRMEGSRCKAGGSRCRGSVSQFEGLVGTWFWSTFLAASYQSSREASDCYISFLLSSFYQLSRRSNSTPNVYFTSYWLFFHMLHFPHLYLFPVSSVFLLFLTFTCTPIYPSTCFHLSFHVLWLCSQPFPSYYDTLYFYVLSSLRSWLIPTQYINWCIFLVVLQFVNWCWFSSSHIFSLSLLCLLKSLSFLSSLSSSSGNYIFTKTKLRPSDLTSWPLTNLRMLV